MIEVNGSGGSRVEEGVVDKRKGCKGKGCISSVGDYLVNVLPSIREKGVPFSEILGGNVLDKFIITNKMKGELREIYSNRSGVSDGLSSAGRGEGEDDSERGRIFLLCLKNFKKGIFFNNFLGTRVFT